MKKNKWIIVILSIIVVSGSAAFLFIKYLNGLHSGRPANIDSNFVDADRRTYTFEEACDCATHIVRAKYICTSGDYDIFVPVELYKGILDPDEEVLHVAVREKNKISYEKGCEYILPLDKTIHVLWDYPHYDIKGVLEGVYISEAEGQGVSLAAELREKYSHIVDPEIPEYYGRPYTRSENLSEIIDFSKYIFEVEAIEVMAEFPDTPQINWYCHIKKLIKGVPDGPGEIIIPFLKGTVVKGKRYLVLLSPNSTKSKIYCLASRDHSLYSLENLDAYPVLKNLYNNAVDYETDNRKKTVSDYLREEWDALGKDTSSYYFNDSGASLYFDEAIYYLQGNNELVEHITENIPDIGVCYYNEGKYHLNDPYGKNVLVWNGDELKMILEEETISFHKRE